MDAPVLTPVDLVARLRASRGAPAGDAFARALAACAKTLAQMLAEKFSTKWTGAYAPEAEAIASPPAGAHAFGAWRAAGNGAPVLRVAMSHDAIAALVETICGGSAPEGAKGAKRNPGFVDSHAFSMIVRMLEEAMAAAAGLDGAAPLVALSRDDAQALEESAPGGMFSGWIELRLGHAPPVRVHLRVAACLFASEADSVAPGVAIAGWHERARDSLARMPTRLSAVIDERAISLADIAACEVGTTLALTASPQSPLVLMARDVALFECHLGQADGYYTLRMIDEPPAGAA